MKRSLVDFIEALDRVDTLLSDEAMVRQVAYIWLTPSALLGCGYVP